MEPGREGREHLAASIARGVTGASVPQWSPAVKAGSTRPELYVVRGGDWRGRNGARP